MRVCFITAGPVKWASARFRGFWVAECMDDAVVVDGETLNGTYPEADVYVFQKIIDLPAAKAFIEAGKQVWWDVCDPMHWFSPRESRMMSTLATGLVASNSGLAMDLQK